MTTPAGIHHVTAIASDPQSNLDFYAGLLGLRRVKLTVNFDDPSAYHLYYGDESGTPGSIVTFFYWPGLAARGQVGSGQMSRISFSATPGSLEWWAARLSESGVAVESMERFGEATLRFADPDGIPLEIVAVEADGRTGWTGGEVPRDYALRGLHTAELSVATAEPTEQVIARLMGFRLVRREGTRSRFEAGPGGSGRLIDLVAGEKVPHGRSGAGTIHHVAWRIADSASELAMQDALGRAGLGVSDVRDRNYFRSIYYREPGGILFEIATDQPGFAVDEPIASLGTALKLPAQFENARRQIEALLPPLRPPQRYRRTAAANTIAAH